MSFQTINPATGETLRTFPMASDAEVATALTAADDCYNNDWKHRAVAARAQIVKRAAALLRQNADEYAGYMTVEMGKLAAEARGEINLSAAILDYYADRADEFLKPQLLAEPGASATQCALAFARLFEQAGAPEGVYTNLFCSVEQVGALIDDFRVRGVTLTGSELAGAAVAERAGRKLKKAVLELGGSDPMIILDDAPLDRAIQQAVEGRMYNMGQACVSTKRVIVVGKERADKVLAGLIKEMGTLKVGDPADPTTSIGPLFSARGLDGLLGQIDGAKSAGATIVLGGKRLNRPGFYLEPTIITDIGKDNPLRQQETFGPVLSFYAVDSEEEAIELANETPFGLGSSVFAADVERAQKVAAKIEAGMVFINSYSYTGPETPFGGIKNSGYGRELGELGIGEFVNRKRIRVAQPT
jgi:succinate-semialdehyde dehydrogenase / glutarate-semialdehyde dehydrogenase